MTVTTTDSIIHFPEGLVGWANWKHFVLLTEQDEELPIGILKSIDDPRVSLMVTDPKLVLPDYTADLTSSERQHLGLQQQEQPVLYCTLTIDGSGEITANLLGPLVVNARTREAKQLVLADTQYSAQHPVGTLESAACSS
jgi:flagellar assembly factor FliW